MNKIIKLVNQIFSSYDRLRLKKEQWKDPKELNNIQFRKLKQIINYAYNYIPYYHRLFSSANIKPIDIRSHKDLTRIPITSKQDLQNSYRNIVARGVDLNKLASSFTSGSSGTPLRIFLNSSDLWRKGALGSYSFFENGVKPWDNFVTVWGRAQSITRLKPYVRFLGSISEIIVPLYTQEKLLTILRQINPDVLNTFPTVLTTLANYNLSGINPRFVFTQGEVVTQHCRDVVNKVFNSELFEVYGSVEFSHLAFECSEHCGLHAITSGSCIEFIDENGYHVSPGEQGEIIVTGLWNYTMPLIRYRIGDSGIPTDEKCPCGRSWPLIQSVQGRINDYIILPSGRKISWLHFYHHFYIELEKNMLSISQYQIIQERKDRIIFKVVKGKEFDPEMLKMIKNNLEKYFTNIGETIEVVMEIVEEIPRGKTGKRRIIIPIRG